MPGSSDRKLDQELVSATLHGDRRAFGELINRYQDGLVNVVYRMCGDPDLAEEAAQEAFIKAWQSLASYRPEYPFKSWIYRIAINKAIDVLRQRPKTVEYDSPVVENTLRTPSEGVEEAVLKRQRVDQVRRALLSLPESGRAVLVLREYQALSYQEIAVALNIPVGTVMSRLNYAREQLRKLLLEDQIRAESRIREVVCESQ